MHGNAPLLSITLDPSISRLGWSQSRDVHVFARYLPPEPPSPLKSADTDDVASWSSAHSASSSQSSSFSTPPSSPPLIADISRTTLSSPLSTKINTSPFSEAHAEGFRPAKTYEVSESQSTKFEGHTMSTAAITSSGAGEVVEISHIALSTLVHSGETWQIYHGTSVGSNSKVNLVVKFIYAPSAAQRSTAQLESKAYARLRTLQGSVVPRFYGLYQPEGKTSSWLQLIMVLEDVGSATEISLMQCDPEYKQKIVEAYERLHHFDLIHNQVDAHHLCIPSGVAHDPVYIVDFGEAKVYDADCDREEVEKYKILELGLLKWKLGMTTSHPIIVHRPDRTWSIEFRNPNPSREASCERARPATIAPAI